MKTDASSFAILGMLSLRPMSGYDLKKAYEQGPAHFWTLNYGQIYPLLSRLQRAGLVEERNRAKSARRRREYSITSKGRSALDRWLELPPGQPTFRNEFLMKLFFAPNDPQQALVHLRNFVEEQERTL